MLAPPALKGATRVLNAFRKIYRLRVSPVNEIDYKFIESHQASDKISGNTRGGITQKITVEASFNSGHV